MLVVRIDRKKYHVITAKTYEDNKDIIMTSVKDYHRAWSLFEEFKYAYFSYKMGKINGVVSSFEELKYFDLYY